MSRNSGIVVAVVFVLLVGLVSCAVIRLHKGRHGHQAPAEVPPAREVAPKPDAGCLGCIEAFASVRVAPDPASEQLTQLTLGEPVKLLENLGGWSRVLPTHYHKVGWVRADVLGSVSGKWTMPKLGSPLAEARLYKGAPYEWGGMTYAGVDCSGLVHMAYRKAYGQLIPRDACDQEACGFKVEFNRMKPGDLITYGNPPDPHVGRATHIAFYLGGGRILNSRKDVGVVAEREPVFLEQRRRFAVRILPNLGRGVWIYDLSQAEDADPAAIVAKAKQAGLRHIILCTARGGEWFGHSPRAKVEELITLCHNEGIRFFGYERCYAKLPLGEAEQAIETLKLGADGFIFDMEGEYQSPGHHRAAEVTLSRVRDWRDRNAPEKILAYSTYMVRRFHSVPWDVLDQFCDVAMPQSYWASFRRSTGWSWDTTWQEYAVAWDDCPITVVPTGQAYDGNHRTVDVPPAELQKFLAKNWPRGVNIFRWELMSKRHWQVLEDKKGG